MIRKFLYCGRMDPMLKALPSFVDAAKSQEGTSHVI